MSPPTDPSVGILATSYVLPAESRSLAEICADERIELSDEDVERLGISSVDVSRTESGADLALQAAQNVLAAAEVTGRQIDVILDYTVLPQHFLVPVWNLGNKLQHELDAVNAFTLGFSGGGTSNFHVALRFATDLIASADGIRTALLFGADIAIPGNRVINQKDPVTLLGDGASALLLAADAEHDVVVATEIVSDGAYHDVCYIPGGALEHLDREEEKDLYRLEIDTARLAQAPTTATLRRLGDRVLERAGRPLDDVRHLVFPNVSAVDQAAYRAVWDVPAGPGQESNRQRHGHVQATDLVLNLAGVTAACDDGDLVLVASHGMGFTAGVTLLRH